MSKPKVTLATAASMPNLYPDENGLLDALAERGFVFKFEKDRVLAESAVMEAQDAKKYLLDAGFRDTEFQVFLEYARKWGVL